MPQLMGVECDMQVMKETHSLKQIHGPDPNFNDICFSGAGRYCLD